MWPRLSLNECEGGNHIQLHGFVMTKAGMINAQPVSVLCEHIPWVYPSSGATRASQGRACQTHVLTLGSPARIFLSVTMQINRLITLISNGRSLLACIYMARAGLTKVQGVLTALHHCCFFSPNQLRSTQPLAFVIPCGSCRSRDEVFLLLSPYCRSLRGRCLCSVDHRQPVSIARPPPRPVIRIYSTSCSGW